MRWISRNKFENSKASAPPMNLVLHKCFRSSHRQGCSPHSPLRKINKDFPTLFSLLTIRRLIETGDHPQLALRSSLREEENSRDKNEDPSHLGSQYTARAPAHVDAKPPLPRARSSDKSNLAEFASTVNDIFSNAAQPTTQRRVQPEGNVNNGAQEAMKEGESEVRICRRSVPMLAA